jgi:hypothetical protein
MKKQSLCIWNALLLAGCIIFISAGSASGAGFALIEQSVSGLGNAAEEPWCRGWSTIFLIRRFDAFGTGN